MGWRAMNSERVFSKFPCARIRCCREGESIVPGQIALQRTPERTKSIAMLFVSPMTPALVVAYTKRFGAPLTLDAPEDILIMLPCPAASMSGRTARQVKYID